MMVPHAVGVVAPRVLTHWSTHSRKAPHLLKPGRMPMRVSAKNTNVGTHDVSSQSPGHGLVPGFLTRVAECNDIADRDIGGKYIPLIVAGRAVGLMQPQFAAELVKAGKDVFEVRRRDDDGLMNKETLKSEETNVKAQYGTVVRADEWQALMDDPNALLTTKTAVTLDHSNQLTPDQRSDQVAPVLLKLKETETITGWRDELFPVNTSYGEEILLTVERASASLLGIKAYGVHVNGYTIYSKTNRVKQLWVARRSKTKQTFPDMLDHLVAGGLPSGMDPSICCVKECEEEASVPIELSKNAKPCGIVTYNTDYKGCCKRDILFVYDLELPEDFVPTPNDGEVEGFELLPIEDAMKLVATSNEFKPNVALVLCDFFVRNGLVTPEEPGYVELVKSLRQ